MNFTILITTIKLSNTKNMMPKKRTKRIADIFRALPPMVILLYTDRPYEEFLLWVNNLFYQQPLTMQGGDCYARLLKKIYFTLFSLKKVIFSFEVLWKKQRAVCSKDYETKFNEANYVTLFSHYFTNKTTLVANK